MAAMEMLLALHDCPSKFQVIPAADLIHYYGSYQPKQAARERPGAGQEPRDKSGSMFRPMVLTKADGKGCSATKGTDNPVLKVRDGSGLQASGREKLWYHHVPTTKWR